jgi:hypothetical protein
VASFDPVHKPTVVAWAVVVLAMFAGSVWAIEWQRGRGVAEPVGSVLSVSESPEPVVVISEVATASEVELEVAPASPEPTPTPTIGEAELEEARASDAWPALAEWDRIEPGVHNVNWFLGGPEAGSVIAAFLAPSDLWNEVVPEFRDILLREWLRGDIEPVDVRFAGKSFEDEFASGVGGWWTNSGSRGRGFMFYAYAFYETSGGAGRVRAWPFLIDPGFMPEGRVDARLTAVGPAVDLLLADFDTIEGLNDLLNGRWQEWLEAEPVRYEPVDTPPSRYLQGGRP